MLLAVPWNSGTSSAYWKFRSGLILIKQEFFMEMKNLISPSRETAADKKFQFLEKLMSAIQEIWGNDVALRILCLYFKSLSIRHHWHQSC